MTKNTAPLSTVKNSTRDDSTVTPETSKAVSGSAMDRKVSTSINPAKKWLTMTLLLLVVAFAVYMILGKTSGKVLAVDNTRIVISNVTSGVFEDFIPIRGRVTPAKTVFLDAIEGGRVERILVEDGTSLSAGVLIVELSNASLQLSVLGNEARVAEQLNNMRSIELNLEQNRLQHKSNIVDINYQIKMLSRQLSREKLLIETGAIMKSKYDDTFDTLQWYKDRLELTKESQQSDGRMQGEQLVFLKDTSSRLESNLAI